MGAARWIRVDHDTGSAAGTMAGVDAAVLLGAGRTTLSTSPGESRFCPVKAVMLAGNFLDDDIKFFERPDR